MASISKNILALLPLGALADRRGTTRVLAAVLMAYAVALALVAFATLPYAVAGCVLFGLAMAGWMLPLGLLRAGTPASQVAWRTALYRVFVDPRPITFVGPAGIRERLEALWEVSWGVDWKPVMKPRFKVKYVVAKPSGEAAGYKYETVKLDHGTSGSNGYRIWVDGRILAYSGDTEPTGPLDELVKGADIAIVEATGPGDVFSHMSWEAAGKLRKRHPDTRFFFNHVYSGTVTGAVKDLQVIEV